MRALLSGRAGLAVAAYAIGWMLAPVLAIGQAPAQNEATVIVEPTPSSQPSVIDAQIAAWLIVDHESEIAICQHAKERLQDETVRRLAQIMLQDHTRLIQDLRPYSGTMLGQLDRANRADELAAQPSRPTNRFDGTSGSVRSAAGQFPALRVPATTGINQDLFLLQLKRELGQEHVTSVQTRFDGQDRDEFDLCFLEQQISAHREMLDTLTVCRKRADGRLGLLLDEALATTKAHLEHAEQMADKHEATNVTAFIPITSADE